MQNAVVAADAHWRQTRYRIARRRPCRVVHNACRMGHLSGNRLEPGREPRLARAVAGLILAVKVREHNFMREERRPFKGVGAIGVGAADQLVLAVGLANQLGVAKPANDLAAVALRNDVFQFHTPPPYTGR